MKHPRFLLVLAIGAIAVAGCSKDKKPEQPTEQKFAVSEYEPDLRDYHSSWGHQGRGGAALRKSAYQHMVSPRDQLDTRSGRLHPELQVASTVPVAMVAVPPSTYASNCQHASLPATYAATGNAVIASAREAVDEYVRVRNKLCQGQSRLTYDEWLVLVNGTPKDLPVAIQAQPPARTPAQPRRPVRIPERPIQPLPPVHVQAPAVSKTQPEVEVFPW
ncbi:hypothetical protein SAMN04244572_02820 [Azotobacter beijerinckii]|uniref:Lipoprotein n=1 Tax=Azotobacter beijerinckii TaxID=170623 RepID=A0A1H6W581_9GAMM|nr:hypothetical protein [Azotobacter beijerinckii]SEJ12129.1 hypothetical protein SAMN04244572_02820 [Azotobacter beijerinckii]